jgi:hypothetical protein
VKVTLAQICQPDVIIELSNDQARKLRLILGALSLLEVKKLLGDRDEFTPDAVLVTTDELYNRLAEVTL